MAERVDTDEMAREIISLALSHLKNGDVAGAEKSVRAALKLTPNANEAWAALHTILSTNPDRATEAEDALKNSTAGRFLEDVKIVNPFSPPKSFEGDDDFYLSDAGPTRGHYMPYQTPDDGKEEWIAKARTAEEGGHYKAARDAWEKVIEIDSSDTWAWSQYAHVLSAHLEEYSKAESAYRRAIEIEPTDDWSHAKLGTMLADKLERVDEGQDMLRQAIELDDSEAHYYAWLGWSLYRHSDKYEGAVEVFERAVELQPDYQWAWCYLALSLSLIEGRVPDAIQAYRTALKLDDKDVASWYNLGVIYHDRSEEYRMAARCFEKASSEIQDDARLWLRLADIYHYQLGKPNKAQKAYLKHLELAPEHDTAWTNYGELCRDELCENEDAIMAFEKAVSANDKNAEAHGQLGALLAEEDDQENYEDACLHLECAIALDPEYLFAVSALIYLKVEHKAPKEEIQPLFDTMFEEIGFDDAHLFITYAKWVGNTLEEIERGRALYMQAFEHYPDNDYLKLMFVIFCYLHSNYYLDLRPHKNFMLDWAQRESLFAIILSVYCSLIEQDDAAARHWLDKVIEDSPEEHLTWHTLGEFYLFRTLDIEAARENMLKAEEIEDDCSALHEHMALIAEFHDEDPEAADKYIAVATQMDLDDLEEGDTLDGPSDFVQLIKLNRGEYEDVIVGARRNIEDEPHLFENYLILMIALEHSGEGAGECAELLEKAKAANHNGYDIEETLQWLRAPLTVPKNY